MADITDLIGMGLHQDIDRQGMGHHLDICHLGKDMKCKEDNMDHLITQEEEDSPCIGKE